MKNEGGNNVPEDINGEMRKFFDEVWSKISSKQVFHICNAPYHDKKLHGYSDNYS
jgi:hypothetical protein